jgi:hypothetical protein
VARAVELLPRKPKALSSNASNTHKKEYSLRKPATNFMTETGVGEGFGVGEGLDKPMEKEKKKRMREDLYSLGGNICMPHIQQKSSVYSIQSSLNTQQ